MKYYELTKEEQALLDAYERGEFKSIATAEKLRFYQQVARNTLQKTRNINIRLSEKDLFHLKSKAARVGMPYQTLVSSVLHQFANETMTIQL